MTNLPPLPPLPPLPGKSNPPKPEPQEAPQVPFPQAPPVPPSFASEPQFTPSAPLQENTPVTSVTNTFQTNAPEPAKKKVLSKPVLVIGAVVVVLVIAIVIAAIFFVPRLLGGLSGNSPIPNPTVTIPVEEPQGSGTIPENQFVVNELQLASGKTLTMSTPDEGYWVNNKPIEVEEDAQYGNSAASIQIITDVTPDQNCALQSMIFDNPPSAPATIEQIQTTVEQFVGADSLPEPKTVTPLTYTGTKVKGYQYHGINVNGRNGAVTAVTFDDAPNVVAYNIFYCEDPNAQENINSSQFDGFSPNAVFYDLK